MRVRYNAAILRNNVVICGWNLSCPYVNLKNSPASLPSLRARNDILFSTGGFKILRPTAGHAITIRIDESHVELHTDDRREEAFCIVHVENRLSDYDAIVITC